MAEKTAKSCDMNNQQIISEYTKKIMMALCNESNLKVLFCPFWDCPNPLMYIGLPEDYPRAIFRDKNTVPCGLTTKSEYRAWRKNPYYSITYHSLIFSNDSELPPILGGLWCMK